MLQPAKIAPDRERHEELFLARYARLRSWALQLTENDRERAEDLVHDAYIQFTFTRPDLEAISNLDGYLYKMLRNLHLSQVRRFLRQQPRTLSIVDYDSAETGLRAADPRERIRLQDELREVCRYATTRKETSKAGSVLILRFLHGYYPREIALLMGATRSAVEERLRVARSEARQYLENPKSLRFLRETSAEMVKPAPTEFTETPDLLLNELRRMIFNSRRGDCFTAQHLENIYRRAQGPGPDHVALGHLVSCPRCLDEVNRLLNLPLLAERFPTDTLGTDTRPKGGDGDDGGGGEAGGGASESELRRCRKRARDVLEHRPSELCVSVNGYLMAAQKVGSELSEQTVSINVEEKIDFVEIFSEQEIRLLFLPVDDGAQRRSARVQLSDDRTLEATLSFGSPWPTLQVIYFDPLLSAESLMQPDEGGELRALPETAQLKPSSLTKPQSFKYEPEPVGSPNFIERVWRRFANTGFWLRPGTITAIVSLLLIAALLFIRLHVPTASAAELLRRAAATEETAFRNPEVVVHRTINLEERRAKGGDLLSRRRIEVWQSSAHGLRLRRIYDERNSLVAGEWTKQDGTSTVYRPGQQPQARTSPDVSARAILETGELWRLNASAKEFGLLVGRTETVTVEEREGSYVLKYENDAAGVAAGGKLMRASLTLDRKDLHALEQTLTVQREGEAREFRFVEAGFEQKPAGSIAPGLFEPEPELMGAAPRPADGVINRTQGADDSPATQPSQPSRAVASPELEIEVTYLLNQIKANLGEQVSMTRTTGGTLHVEALVETEGRKEEILRALGPVINNPAVKVEVSTVAEAARRDAKKRGRPGDVTVREVEVANNRIPADADLRAYFSKRLVGGEAIDEEISRYSNRVMIRSRQALLRASALKRLVARFSPEELRALAPEARAKWLLMIREQALSYQRETAALRQELRSVFGGAGDATVEAVNEANLTQAADHLLQLSYANDEAVRSAFTISADGHTAEAIKSAQFWRSLATAEKLAGAIERVYEQK
ncbi:MAG TPA: RNA polymerase sigma factor [Pyrinomonadaceae bacterium]